MSEPTPPINPFAPPQSPVQDFQPLSSAQWVLASRGRRFAGALIDLILVGGLVAITSMLFSFNLATLSDNSLSALAGFSVSFLAVVFLQSYLLATRGQSLAKIILKMRILRPDGSRVSALRIIGLRYFLPGLINGIPIVGMIFSLVNPLMIFRSSRRCLHDDIADTIVLKI